MLPRSRDGANWLHDGLRAIKPLRTTVQHVRRALRPYRARVWTLQGAARASALPLRLTYAGQLESKNYFSHLALAPGATEDEQRTRWVRELLARRAENFAHADLYVADVARSVYRQYAGAEDSQPHTGAFVLPCWVKGEISLAPATRPQKLPETIRSDLRLIKRNRLEYRVARDRAMFDWFYDAMYLPYITKAYPGRAFLMSYDDMRAHEATSELVFIHRDGADIAGQIVVHRDGYAQAWSVGVIDGDPAYVKAGALAALYYFVPRYLADTGYARLDVGLSRPFLKDGVLQHKKKWGQRVVAGHEKLLILRIARGSAAAHEFLRNNPFIYIADGELRAGVFVTAAEAADTLMLERLRKSYFIPGIASLRFFVPDADGIHTVAAPCRPFDA